MDAFLRLTVTPQITSEGTIFLNVDVENTMPDFPKRSTRQPGPDTQQATTQVLVTDGGTVVIGGVIQTQNSLSTFRRFPCSEIFRTSGTCLSTARSEPRIRS